MQFLRFQAYTVHSHQENLFEVNVDNVELLYNAMENCVRSASVGQRYFP
jgi:hypothetical protein